MSGWSQWVLRMRSPATWCAICLLALGAQQLSAEPSSEHDDARIHERLLVLDTHLDTPHHFPRPGWDIGERHSYVTDLSQVDCPRMLDGGLDGGFWAIYTPQGPLTPEGYARARDYALHELVQIREVVARNSGRFSLAATASDARRIEQLGRLIVYQSMENAYPIGTDLSLLDTFHALGVRMLGPVHSAANQFADSATAPPKWHGLSPLGMQLVQRANQLGVVLDASHASDAAFDQMLQLSRTPIVLSHSGLKAILDHPRNIDDVRLRRLAASGGVLQVAAVSHFLVDTPAQPQLASIREEMNEKLRTYTAAQAAQLAIRAHRAMAEGPVRRAKFDDFMRSVLRAIQVAGVDHVGIGADWDGGAGLDGFEDVSDLPKVTAALRRAGYEEADIAKIMGGNVLRVLERTQQYAARQRNAN